jgi:hypothetical protein
MIRDDPSKLPRIVACTFWWDGMAAIVWITAIAWSRHSCVQRYGVLRDIFAKRASEFQVNLVDDRKHPLFLEQLIEPVKFEIRGRCGSTPSDLARWLGDIIIRSHHN